MYSYFFFFSSFRIQYSKNVNIQMDMIERRKKKIILILILDKMNLTSDRPEASYDCNRSYAIIYHVHDHRR